MQTPGCGQGKSFIQLEDGHVPWHVCGDRRQGQAVAYVRGHASHGDQFFEDADLARHIHELAERGRESLQAAVPNLNGGWAFVVEWPAGDLLAAVDRLRTIPLFYRQVADKFEIGDSGRQLARRGRNSLDLRGQLEFLLFLYVTGSDTLYEGVNQMQSGEMLFYQSSNHSYSTTRYFRFYPTVVSNAGAKALADELADTLQQMFERLREGFHGKRVAIPLSGGLDSRLVAAMLKRVGIRDCICFTYGHESDEEVRLSRQVAEALGLPWRLVPFTPELCTRWNESQILAEFIRYGCKGTSLTHPQDYPAVLQLAEEGLQGADVVYFPGHSADMNAGSHIPPDYHDIQSGRLTPVEHIMRTHARGVWDDPSRILDVPAAKGLMEKFAELTAVPPGATIEDRIACCELWNAEQRQAKYIINSVRTYEFVGTRWRTLWDYEFMDFFLRVPVELRYGQKLYLDCLRDKIFVGEFAPLSEIPLSKLGPLSAVSSVRGPANASALGKVTQAIKRQVRMQLLKAGLARRHLNAESQSQLTRVRLAGLGIPDGPITLQETLDRTGALWRLSPEIREALQPWLGYRLESLRYRTVFTVLALAEMTKDTHLEQGLRNRL